MAGATEAGPGLPAGGADIGGLPGGGQEVSPDADSWNLQWTKEGQALVGTLLQFAPFRNGHKCKVVTDDGEVCLFSAPQNLAEKLQLVPIGHRVGMQLVELRKSKQASPFKVFRVVNYGRSR
jgi:hypothetical protein